MRLVVGLGNPGRRYVQTRHNAGFAVVDALAAAWQLAAPRRQLHCETYQAARGGGTVVLAKPQSFMNLSGVGLGALVQYFKVPPAALLVVHDELDLAVGTVRFKRGGGHGGHNGLRSISAALGPDYARLRIGIGRPPGGAEDGADYVLSRPQGEARAALAAAIEVAAEAAVAWLDEGLEAAMQRLHRRR